MLLLAWLGRQLTCSSVSDSTHARKRGQYSASSFRRENARKRSEVSGCMAVMTSAFLAACYRTAAFDFQSTVPRIVPFAHAHSRGACHGAARCFRGEQTANRTGGGH